MFGLQSYSTDYWWIMPIELFLLPHSHPTFNVKKGRHTELVKLQPNLQLASLGFTGAQPPGQSIGQLYFPRLNPLPSWEPVLFGLN